jgi:hypothetical protein
LKETFNINPGEGAPKFKDELDDQCHDPLAIKVVEANVTPPMFISSCAQARDEDLLDPADGTRTRCEKSHTCNQYPECISSD